jgi:hypothetical protein
LVEVVTSGVIKYPPQMYEAIQTWAAGMYASWVANKAAKSISMLSDAPELLLLPGGTFTLRPGREHDQQLADLRAIESAARKLGKKPKVSKRPTKTFKVDLRGLNPKNYPIDRMTSVTDKVKVTLNMDADPSRWVRGYWKDRKIVMMMPFFDPAQGKVSDFADDIDNIKRILKHELQHMVQTLISDATEKSGDADWAKFQEKMKDVPEKEQYWLLPQEFHTWILTSKQDLLTAVRNTRPEYRKDGRPVVALKEVRPNRKEFDSFVGNPKPVTGRSGIHTSEFFQALHKYDRPRWKLAMREFYRLMAPLMDK